MEICNLFVNPLKINLHSELIPYILIYGILFMLNPTIALLVSAITLFSSQNPLKRQYYTFYILLACWIGVLNMTKQLFSDQIYYARIFVRADTSDFFNAIWNYRGKDFLTYKEIVFNIYSVFCNLLTNANPRAYFFILTVNIYLLHFLALHKVLFASERSKWEVLCAVILMAFFTPFFIQSIHAVRQILATSFVVYAIAYRAVSGKDNWLFLIVAFFIHNSTIFFILLAFIPYLYRKLDVRQSIMFLLIFGLFTVFYVQVGVLLDAMDIGVMSSVGRRLISAGSSAEDKLFSLRVFYIYTIPTLISSFFILRREYRKENPLPIICFSYLSILTFFLIEGFSGAVTVQFRYMFYMYSFIPFVLLFPEESTGKWQRIFYPVITVFFVSRFFLVDTDWSKFANWFDILTNSFFYFWNTPYYIV